MVSRILCMVGWRLMAKMAADMVHPCVVPLWVAKWWYLSVESFQIVAEGLVYHAFVSSVRVGHAFGTFVTMSALGRLVKASLMSKWRSVEFGFLW